MQIFVRDFASSHASGTLAISVDARCSVNELTGLIQDRCGIPHQRQRLVFNGKQLENERALSGYCIQAESTLYLLPRWSIEGLVGLTCVKRHTDESIASSACSSTHSAEDFQIYVDCEPEVGRKLQRLLPSRDEVEKLHKASCFSSSSDCTPPLLNRICSRRPDAEPHYRRARAEARVAPHWKGSRDAKAKRKRDDIALRGEEAEEALAHVAARRKLGDRDAELRRFRDGEEDASNPMSAKALGDLAEHFERALCGSTGPWQQVGDVAKPGEASYAAGLAPSVYELGSMHALFGTVW